MAFNIQRGEINKNEIGGACWTHEKEEKYIQIFGLKVWRKRTPSRSIVGLAERLIIKWFLKKEWEDMKWMRLDRGRLVAGSCEHGNE
jgi:hypothetical protein